MSTPSRLIAALLFLALPLAAQTPAPAPAADDKDKPSFRVGGTIFADYTYQDSPQSVDADGNRIHASSFNVARAYINVTGNLNHWITYRITPDVARETSSTSSLSGSQEYRLKFAFVQFSLDDWLPVKGSWVRAGVQQTPYMDYTEGIYRYRFQGSIFVERVGALSASDAGISGRYNFAGNHGEIHAGYYNGENYNHIETNNEKAFQLRATWRPLPANALFKGLRITGFFDDDHYVEGAKRQRVIGHVTYEHPRGTVGLEALSATDRPSTHVTEVKGRGWTLWGTPKLAKSWELLLRHDDFKPNTSAHGQKQRRDIVGIAYWVPRLSPGLSVAFLLDRDSLHQSGFTPSREDDTRYGVKMLVSF
jgi:hypothetical protein